MTDKAVHIAFYPSNWLAGTRGLTPAETGVYITLVCMMYERQAPLPFEHARLARMCNCPAGTFKKILAVLLEERKLIETPEGLWQRRVEKEIGAARTAIDEASDRAKRAAEARWSKVKPQSDHREIVTVTPQSVEQKDTQHMPEKGNKNSNGTMQLQCPSNANQNQNQRYNSSSSSSACAPADAEQSIPEGLIPKLTHALGFDLHGQVPKYWVTPEAGMIVGRWRSDLGLTDDEIVAVAVGSAKAHNGPANGPKVLNQAMARYAAEKSAPPLQPSSSTQPGHAADRPKGHGIRAQIPEKYRQ